METWHAVRQAVPSLPVQRSYTGNTFTRSRDIRSLKPARGALRLLGHWLPVNYRHNVSPSSARAVGFAHSSTDFGAPGRATSLAYRHRLRPPYCHGMPEPPGSFFR